MKKYYDLQMYDDERFRWQSVEGYVSETLKAAELCKQFWEYHDPDNDYRIEELHE